MHRFPTRATASPQALQTDPRRCRGGSGTARGRRSRHHTGGAIPESPLLVRSLTLFLILCLATTASATDHSGTCTGTFLAANNPHRLTNNCTVTVGQTLTLEPGVVLNGQGLSLIINGTLVAAGTAMQPITLDTVAVAFRAGSAGQISGSIVRGPLSPPHISINDASPTISGNTMSNSANSTGSVLIAAGGGSMTNPTISTNQMQVTPGGTGISYGGAARGTVMGNTITFGAAFGFAATGIRLINDASPRIEANSIANNPAHTDVGMQVFVSEASAVQIINNDICSTGSDTPINFGMSFFGAPLAEVMGNTLSCGFAAGFILSGNTASAVDHTLIAINGVSTYRLTSNVTVGVGARLIIPAGFSLVSNGFTLNALGSLVATGASFTNILLTLGPDSGSSMLTDNTITGSGSVSMLSITGSAPTVTGNSFSGAATAVAVSSGAPALNGNTFTGVTEGISVTGTSTLTIENNTFITNTRAIRINDAASQVTVTNNTFDRNTASVSFPNFNTLFSAFPMMLETNQFLGATSQNRIPFPNTTVDASGTLPGAPVAYSTNSVTIPVTTTLVLSPGVVIQPANNASITVKGQLVGEGTQDKPIRFTSSSPKTGGRWGGLAFANQAASTSSVLDACIIEFAGGGNASALKLDNADISVLNSRISDNNAVGIELINGSNVTISNSAIVMNLGDGIRANTGSAPTISFNSIFANGGNGVNKQDCPVASNLIDAQNNFWGDDSGPRDASDDRAGGGLFNPGAGDEVSNCVDFDPWIRLGPSVAGTITGISGGGQMATVGTCLPNPLVVEILSTLGSPLQGIDVIFSVVSGDASIGENQPVQTGADGRAQATVCLGATPGDIVIAVTARDVNSPFATFLPTAEPAGPCLFRTVAAPAPNAPCAGDCDGDGRVTVNELITGVDIALGNASMAACLSLDRGSDGEVTIDDLLSAVDRALGGCPTEESP